MKIRALADLDRHVEALGEVDRLLAADEHDSWARATEACWPTSAASTRR